MSREEERRRLLREIGDSRHQLAGDLVGLGHAVNVRERFHDVVRRHPEWWIGGGIVAGLALAKVAFSARRPGNRKGEAGVVSTVKRSFLFGLLGIVGKELLLLSEPALKRLARQQIERWMAPREPAPVRRPDRDS